MINLITIFALIAVMLGLNGCESIGERLQARFTPEPPRVKLFTSDYEQVLTVTKQVLSEMGFRSIRGRASSRKLSGVSRVNANDALSGASQISVKVEFIETMPGETEMQVWMTEVVEDQFTQSGGYATQMPIRGDLLYNMLFRGVELMLKED
jgi:hypothetical protein